MNPAPFGSVFAFGDRDRRTDGARVRRVELAADPQLGPGRRGSPAGYVVRVPSPASIRPWIVAGCRERLPGRLARSA
ncbi:MAG TPA: hypothetical protein VFQ68_45345 [Streptosporangiaceae bacterium]|nr:hypothetical protein [Streptosporangiaceae bacterium]